MKDKPTIDRKTGDVKFPNGKEDNVYEGSDLHLFEPREGDVYWLCFGHEEIVIWDKHGYRLFNVFTR